MSMIRIAALLALVGFAISGCSPTMEVENQAYVLVMGLDRLPDGRMEVSVRVPKIGQSSVGDKNEASGDDPYLTFSVQSDGFAGALDRLRSLTPRELNLSHITLLVVSDTLASESGFGALIRRVAETKHLYTTARFVICEGSAADFVGGIKTVIGTRLSADIDASFDHYARCGSIPDSNLAEVYYAGLSFYSDPAAAVGHILSGSDDARNAPSTSDPESMGGSVQESPSRLIYEGSAVFRDGSLALKLDARQTLLMNLALGRLKSFSFDFGGDSVLLAVKTVRRSVSGLEHPSVSLEVLLSCEEPVPPERLRAMEAELEEALGGLVGLCQSARVDPLGFAEKAVGRFSTFDAWIEYDWRSRFAAADVSIAVHISLDGMT